MEKETREKEEKMREIDANHVAEGARIFVSHNGKEFPGTVRKYNYGRGTCIVDFDDVGVKEDVKHERFEVMSKEKEEELEKERLEVMEKRKAALLAAWDAEDEKARAFTESQGLSTRAEVEAWIDKQIEKKKNN